MLEPLKFYSEDEGLKFYLIDCESGLMHLIVFPDNTVMLFDCNVTNKNEETIINFLDKHIPKRYDKINHIFYKAIDIFVNSHRDLDHLRGLKMINENFNIKSIWDSGQTGGNTDNDDYKYYMYLRRKLKEENEKNLIVPVPSNIELCTIGETKIFCLAAEEDFKEDYSNEIRQSAKIQHTNSMVLLLVYANKKMLLTGDSDWKSWKEKIVPNFSKYSNNYENTDILIASHHGSRSFFTDEMNEHIDEEVNPETTYIKSIELIKPIITLISCGDYEEYHHPNKEALNLYKKWTSGGQVYTTHELGTICGIITNDGNISVIPNRFYNSISKTHIGFDIICKSDTDGCSELVKNGESIPVGGKLKFEINSWGNIINEKDCISIIWEVSNSGVDKDYEHQEIYYKGKEENDGKFKFSRDLSYKGTHLLRCKINNANKAFSGTRVFVVKGV